MYRYAIEQLKERKKSKYRKPLIIEGARAKDYENLLLYQSKRKL